MNVGVGVYLFVLFVTRFCVNCQLFLRAFLRPVSFLSTLNKSINKS
jgi:hypothetical protein